MKLRLTALALMLGFATLLGACQDGGTTDGSPSPETTGSPSPSPEAPASPSPTP
jgi:hypothetical protein